MSTANQNAAQSEQRGPLPASAAPALGVRLQYALQQYWPLVVAAVLVLQTALILDHEHFADEWQAVQIAVQSPDLTALLTSLRYESHPPLWYLWLRAIAAMVGGHHALMVSTLILGLGSQLALLLRAPLPHWARLLASLSVPILYEFSVISRGLTLGMALVMAVLVLWPHRRLVWLPIALLPCVDFLLGVVSLIFICMRWREGALNPVGLVGWLVVSVFSAWSILPADDYITVYGPSQGTALAVQMAVMRFSVLYLPMQGFPGGFTWNAGLADVLMYSLWAAYFLTIWEITKGRLVERAGLFGFAAIMFVISAWAYPMQYRHCFVLSLMMIAILWRRSAMGQEVPRIAAIWLALGACAGLWTSAQAFDRPFESSREAAQFIRKAGLAEQHWVALPDMAGQNVSALTGLPFENYHHGCMQYFIRWNTPRETEKPSRYLPWLEQAAQERGRFYVMSKNKLPDNPAWRELASFTKNQVGVPYWLYVIGEGKAPARLDLPPKLSPELSTKLPPKFPLCVPGTRPFAAEPAI